MLSPKQQSVSYFPALTGVRAISAFLVYVHHFNPIPVEFLGERLFKIIREGHIGVTLFFLLSGFLIAYRYYNKDKIDFRQYMVNRIARIYPVYFALNVLTFIVKPEAYIGSFQIFLLNISFLRGFFHQFLFSGISQGWSLTVEEMFYFLAPGIFTLIKRSKYFIVLLPILFSGIGLALVYAFKGIDFHGFFLSEKFMFSYTFLGRSTEFMTGIALALLYKKYPLPRKGFLFTFSGCAIIGICMAIFAFFAGEAYSYGVFHPTGIFVNNVLLPVFGVSIFFYGLLVEKTWLSALLSTPFLVLLGKSSYVFYMIHMGVISEEIMALTGNLFIHFIGLNVVSILIFKFFEEPVNNLIRKRFSTIS